MIRNRERAACAYGWLTEADRWVNFPDLGTFRIRPDKGEVALMAGKARVPAELSEIFETAVLPLAYQLSGLEALHASGVRTARGVVGFCALSETGKSTIAYGLSLRGHPHWTDDVLVLEERGGHVFCRPVPYSTHLRTATAGFFAVDAAGMDALRGEGSGGSQRLAAIVLLEQDQLDAFAEWRRLSPSEALPALLPHAFRFTLRDLQRTRETTERYLRLLATVPILNFHFTPGFDHFEQVLDRLESAIASCT